MFFVTCPSCQKKGQVPDEFLEKRIKCGGCGNRFLVEAAPISDHEILFEEPIPDELLDIVSENHEPLAAPLTDVDSFLDSLKGAEDHPPANPGPAISLSRHEAPMDKNWEYKVLTQKDKWFSGKFDPEKLEGAMNSYASQGWRVIAVTTANIPGFGGNRDELIVVLER